MEVMVHSHNINSQIASIAIYIPCWDVSLYAEISDALTDMKMEKRAELKGVLVFPEADAVFMPNNSKLARFVLKDTREMVSAQIWSWLHFVCADHDFEDPSKFDITVYAGDFGTVDWATMGELLGGLRTSFIKRTLGNENSIKLLRDIIKEWKDNYA